MSDRASSPPTRGFAARRGAQAAPPSFFFLGAFRGAIVCFFRPLTGAGAGFFRGAAAGFLEGAGAAGAAFNASAAAAAAAASAPRAAAADADAAAASAAVARSSRYDSGRGAATSEWYRESTAGAPAVTLGRACEPARSSALSEIVTAVG